jgi:hypothetical protein
MDRHCRVVETMASFPTEMASLQMWDEVIVFVLAHQGYLQAAR